MGLFDFWRRKPPIRDLADLATYIDERAAFLVQKGIYDYARARSGHYAKVMLADGGFQAALDASRWRAYPLGLAMVAEMVEGVFDAKGDDRRAVLDPLIRLTLGVFDRYPLPSGQTEEQWDAARAELALHLERLSTHPPKPVLDIPEPFFERYFAMMPFDKQFLTADAPTAKGFMQITLVNMKEDLIERIDVAAMAEQIRHA
jgi:hypothetical protein